MSLTCSACGQENPAVARFCLACGAPLAADGRTRDERRVVSIVFVDLVGFTARSDRLDPEDVRAILSPYYDKVRAELESYGGVVEKFIGDAVMAVFGAPVAYGDDAERAVRAALAVCDSVGGDLDLRIAVNTGEAVVALGARPNQGEGMVAGDVVNTAARLQQTATVGGVVVGEQTHRATRDVIRYEECEPVVAKGKSEPIRAWRALEALAPEGERPLSGAPLIGRDRELALLRDLWERAASERRPHLVTLIAPAGLGKTRLAVEFVRIVEASGGIAVRGRSLPYREHSAYGPFATQVKLLAGIFDSDETEVALTKLRTAASRLLGDADASQVAEHLGILLGFGADATAPDRESLFASARFFVEAVARDAPTLVVFEDLHWADESLLDLIEHFARLHDLPLLILTLARTELLDTRPTWGGGLLAYTALPLEPLGEQQSLELARALLPHASDLGAVTAAAEGNPLFLEQLAAVMREGETGADELPTTIRGLVAARLDALPESERSLLLDAAVVGKVFWRGAVERLTTSDAGETLAALERRDLIRRDPSSSIEGDEQYFFKHVLIREVAYELLPRERRRHGHAVVAKFVEESTPEVGEAAAALARHWLGAGDRDRAIDYFIAAANEAERGWAKDLAASLYKEALELTDDEEQRRTLRRRLAVAQQASYHIRDAWLLRKESRQA